MPNRDAVQMPTLEIPVEFDMASAERSMRDIERRSKQTGDESAQHISEASGETKTWTDRLKAAASAAGGLALIVGNRLARGFRGFGRVLGGVLSALVDVTAIGMMGVSRGLHRMDAELEDNAVGWKVMGDAAGGAATILDKMASVLLRVSAAMAGVQVAAGLTTAAVLVAANRASARFTPAWNRVLTLLEGTPTELQRLRVEVSDLAGELGVDGVEAAKTFYQVLSAMPELTKEPIRALSVLRVALEAGATGFTESSEAARAVTAVLNAFGKEAEDAREVADALFATQNQGVTTFGEIGASIGRVSGVASALEADYRDLLAIVATLTSKAGADTAEAFTQARAALNNILKPSADAQKAAKELGIEFSATAVRTRGFNRFLLDLIETTEGRPELLARFFGSQEALAGVVSLAGHTETLASNMDLIVSSGGEGVEILDQINDSAERQAEILRGQLSAALRDLGDDFEDLQIDGLRAMNFLIAKARELDLSMPAAPSFDVFDEWGRRFGEWIFGMDDAEREARELIAAQRELMETQGLAAAQSIPGVRGGPLGPIPRPAEPTSIDYSRWRIQQLEMLRQAKAIAELARSGDMEAYEAAVRSTQEAVNDLVLAEMDRLRAAGVEEREVAKLASAYRVLREETDRTAEAKKRLQEQLSDRVFRLTADAIDLEAQALDRLATEIKEKFGEIPDEMAAQLEQLRQNIERSRVLATFQEQFQALGRGPATLETADAMAALHDQLREEAEQLPENLQLREEYLELLHQIASAIDRIRDSERKAQGATEDTAAQEKREAAERLRALREQARTIEENARAGIQLAEAFGLIGSEAAAALEDVAQLGTAIFRIAGGDLSAIPSAIGAVASLISGMFSGAEENPAIRENSERLRELTAGIAELSQALAGISGELFTGVASALQATIAGVPEPFFFDEKRIEFLRLELAKLGLTMDDLDEVAKALGIEFDGSAASVKALHQAIGLIEFERLFETFGGQLSLLQQKFEIMDIDDPIEQLRQFLNVIHQFAGAEIDPPVWNLDSEEGRTLAKRWVQKMFELLQSGEITPEQLGGLSFDEFRDFLDEFNRRLEEANEAAQAGGVVGGPEQTRVNVNQTVAQANQMISLDMTRNRYLAQVVALLGGDVGTAGGGGAPHIPTFPGEISPPSLASLGLSPAPSGGGDVGPFTFGDINVEIPIQTTGDVDPGTLEEAGRRAGQAFSEELKRELGNRHRGQGGHGSPKVLTVGATR